MFWNMSQFNKGKVPLCRVIRLFYGYKYIGKFIQYLGKQVTGNISFDIFLTTYTYIYLYLAPQIRNIYSFIYVDYMMYLLSEGKVKNTSDTFHNIVVFLD